MEPAFFNLIRLSVLLLWIYAQFHGTMGQPPAGFISLVCGGSAYDDPNIQDLHWMSDESFVYGGDTATVNSPSSGDGTPRFTTVRYFPGNQTKYCYTLPNLTPRSYYLVRASFWYGTQSIYETAVQNKLTFKLLIDADEWASISIDLPQESPVVQEVYVRAMDVSIAVCLSGKEIGFDIPFISAIELRPLNSDLTLALAMAQTQKAFFKEYRLNYGSNSSVRYPDDHFDRIWDGVPSTLPSTHTDLGVQNNLVSDLPPVLMLQTALGGDGLSGFQISLPIYKAQYVYYYALYFAEIDSRVNRSGQRMFEIYLNDGPIWTYLDIYSSAGGANTVYEIYCAPNNCSQTATGSMNFSFQAYPNSTYGPLLNGLELLRLKDTPQSNGTFAGDVSAIKDIIKAFRLSGWAGDPCLPYAYTWLNCSQQSSAVRINALSLSNQGLVGTIPPIINDLTELVQISLDQNELQGDIPNLSALENLTVLILNNNSLSGSIPDFLSDMPALTTLLLQYNNFSGQVPATLLQRSKDSSLHLDITGNPLLCGTECSQPGSPHKKRNHWALIIGLLAAFVILGWAVACFAIVRARRSNTSTSTNSTPQPPQQNVIRHTEIVERSNIARVFSYHEIEIATENFRRQLGEGGFGHVYYGTLQSVGIAVKVLSEDSRQGVREFLNEVGVLCHVHHKNLVRLVGYCIERRLVLVYEYMSKGALRDSLHRAGVVLNWRTRLHIALSTAQGLEYLHVGCSPRIIHRDVKSSNILLNDNMEAKLGDFGISKTTPGELTSLASTLMIGTPGYVDPEYANNMQVSEKMDIYSFGVVLFEIISGQPPIWKTHPSGQIHIIDWAKSLLHQGKIHEMVDSRIGDAYNVSSAWKVVELAMKCVDSNSINRPTMTEVCADLRGAMDMAMDMEYEKETTLHPSSSSLDHSQSTTFLTMSQVQAR